MPSFHPVQLILFLALLNVLLAAARWINRPFRIHNRYLAGVYLIIAGTLFHGYLILSDEIARFPHALSFHSPALFLVGPLYLRWIRALLDVDEEPHFPLWLEALPALIA